MKRPAGNAQGGAVSDTYEQKKIKQGKRRRGKGKGSGGGGKQSETGDETAMAGLYAYVYVRADRVYPRGSYALA